IGLAIGGKQLLLLQPRCPVETEHIGGTGSDPECSHNGRVAINGNCPAHGGSWQTVGCKELLLFLPSRSVEAEDVRSAGRVPETIVPVRPHNGRVTADPD